MFRRFVRRRQSSVTFRPTLETLESRQFLSVSLASQGPGGVPAGLPGVANNNPAVSDDGRFVVFASTASNLVAGDDNNAADIFVRDRTNNTTTLVSAAPDGSVGNGASGDPGGFRTGYTISGSDLS